MHRKAKIKSGLKRKKSLVQFGKQKEYKVTIKSYFDYLQKGQYLFIVSDMGDNKMDLPESLKVEKAFAPDSAFVIQLSDNKRFDGSRYFMSKLDTESLRLQPIIGLSNEDDLIVIWEKYNGKF